MLREDGRIRQFDLMVMSTVCTVVSPAPPITLASVVAMNHRADPQLVVGGAQVCSVLARREPVLALSFDEVLCAFDLHKPAALNHARTLPEVPIVHQVAVEFKLKLKLKLWQGKLKD
jgi:hypothetical protein